MEKLKRFLIAWLGIDEYVIAERTRVDRKIGKIMDLVNIGVDFHPMQKYSGRWAVVCLKGRPEYVNFINLKYSDAREIQHFLRSFSRRNTIVDDPFHSGGVFTDGRY